MTGYTQGPWRKFNIDLSNKTMHQRVGPALIKNKISPADAFLIGAAPELFEESRALIAKLEEMLPPSYLRRLDLDGLRAAIASAEPQP